jgi:UDP-3-O-[3-hydroxymyristoyl] glucosamine N-acyltransferase
MAFSVSYIAECLHGEVQGDGTVELTGFAAAEHAGAGDLTFAETNTFLAAAEETEAAAILMSGEFPSTAKVLIRVPDARAAVAQVLPLFFPPAHYTSVVHPSATVADSAQIDSTAHIGPHCVVGDRVRLGARSVLVGGNHIDHDCQIGDDVTMHPNVVVYAQSSIGDRVTIHAGTVIGSDGYSYVFDGGRHRKMLHVGQVIIHDDVEIGANSAIDRGALGATIIGEGTKIDNLVHIAHNVVIGRHCLVMGQVGFAGSTQLGDYCVIASQSGIAGHLKLGNQCTVGAKSGVMRDVPDRGTVFGYPAGPDKQVKRHMVAVTQLPDFIRRIRELEKKVAELTTPVGH